MSKLYFNIGDMEGFTSNKLADRKQGFAIPIRELLQNSLDASREANNDKCQIDIYLETIKCKDIPHITEYKKILGQSINTQEKLNSYNTNSQNVVASIEEALDNDDIKILMFTDNGKGMTKEVLEGLLDERSIKLSKSSSGSYGLGHLSSYFLSSLRYVLYATKYKDDNGVIKSLWTGSPILAGHEDDEARRCSKGRVLKEEPENKLKPDFVFPEQFPDFIKSKMDRLETGSMVVILGLNEEWGDDAEYVIASNFFHTIGHDGLVVNIHNNEQKSEINDNKINELIEQRKDKMRKEKQSDDVLSGRMVYHAYQAVFKNVQKNIELDNGDKISVYIENDIDSNSGIVLIRNGMVVARHDSMLSGDMDNLRHSKDFQSFVAVIDVDIKYSPELFPLVKGAENPYHNKLQSKKLSKVDEKKLKELFKKLSEKIKIHLKEIDREGFGLTLFDMPIKGDIKGGTNSNPLSRPDIGKPKREKSSTTRKPPKICPDCEQTPCVCPNKPEPRPMPEINSRQLESRNDTRYIDKGKTLEIRTIIKPNKQPNSKDNVYFSIALAEDNDNNKVSEFVVFKSLCINKNEVSKDNFMEGNMKINLGKLNEANTYNIIATITKPSNFDNIKIALEPFLGLKQDRRQQ